MMQTANFPGRKNARRFNAAIRVSAQLEGGTKSVDGTGEPLTVADRARLNREADTLALRLRPAEVVRAIRTKKDRSGTGRLSRTA